MSGDKIINGLQEAIGGDLISREAHLDLLAAVIAANSGTVLRLPGTADTLTMGELTEQVDALRALPAAPEAGEVERLREALAKEVRTSDGLYERLSVVQQEKSGAEARLAEVEAERNRFEADAIRYNTEARDARGECDAALAQVAGAYEAAAKEAAALGDGHDGAGMAEAIRALTPTDASAVFERAVEARVQAALAKEEAAHEITIKQRDKAEDAADKLARAIGGDAIGEHSSINDPWANALRIAAYADADREDASALAAQGEPVAGRYEARICKGMPADCCDYGVISLDTGLEICRVWKGDDARRIAGLLNAAPASAGVTVKPLVEQVASLIDGVMADDAEGIDRLDDAARLLERILAALSQPAQG